MEKDTCAPRQQHSGGAPEELALRGGLQGRMAGGFGALQSSVDALQRYLACNAPPQLRQTALDLLDDMTGRIAQLYRLSCNAARLAAGAGMRGADEAAPLELSGYLSARKAPARCGCWAAPACWTASLPTCFPTCFAPAPTARCS